MIIKISIFGHEICNLKKDPKVAYVLSFYPRGLKLSLFSLLHAAVFKIRDDLKKKSLFGHEIWNLEKDPKVAYVLSFYPKGVEIKLIFALRTAFLWRYQFSIFAIKSGIPKLHM